MLDNKTVLITGGTGSFGHAFARRLLATNIGEIRIFSRDEWKQDAMRHTHDDSRLRFYLGDVREKHSVDDAMQGAHLVFHAAALKQVPSCEFFPMQALQTNTIGSSNVIDSASEHGVGSVVCLSTDKAVMPINAMGMTKALMEKIALAKARRTTDTVVSVVRYGNVMYSRGSVIPLLISQIRASRPLTLTDPNMTRFMLSLDDALDLVEFALANSRAGDIFIRKAPAATVGDLAASLQDLSGTTIPIKEIGVRHGEKLFETLATAEELRRADDLGDYFRIAVDDRDLDYDKYFVRGDTSPGNTDDYTSHNTRRLTGKHLQDLLISVPEIKRDLDSLRAERGVGTQVR